LAKANLGSQTKGLRTVLAKANLVFPKKKERKTYRLKIDCHA
jgi:hypothetical protein